jgi:CheY-like chemotaxis protein
MSNPEFPALRGKHVLVVDDDADTRELLSVILNWAGAAVTAVGSAAEALDACASSSPDVVLSDIGLPGEDGFSLVRRLRALPGPRGRDVPAIALTGYDRASDRARVESEGFVERLTKPVTPDTVLAAVSRAVGGAVEH